MRLFQRQIAGVDFEIFTRNARSLAASQAMDAYPAFRFVAIHNGDIARAAMRTRNLIHNGDLSLLESLSAFLPALGKHTGKQRINLFKQCF